MCGAINSHWMFVNTLHVVFQLLFVLSQDKIILNTSELETSKQCWLFYAFILQKGLFDVLLLSSFIVEVSVTSLLDHSVSQPAEYRFLLTNLIWWNYFLIGLGLTCIWVDKSKGGFNLHFLVFPFIYQFNSRIRVLNSPFIICKWLVQKD